MRIAVLADNDQWSEINTAIMQATCTRVASLKELPGEADAYLFLQNFTSLNFDIGSKPVFINAVCTSLNELTAPENIIRINGWHTFLGGSVWEVSGSINERVLEILAGLGKQAIKVPDEPGFVTARVVAMIINEAYFALEDKVSTRQEIDIAMKLGTNYPYGPFEWASLIGTTNVYSLLEKLSINDDRYQPAGLLKAATKE